MCGLFGVIHRDPRRPIDAARLSRSRDTLRHRGPDEAGAWLGAGVGLGHRRLRVIDLATGQQPMTSDDGRMVLVYNGEIYDFARLRRELAQEGAAFQSQSDTEVLLRLHEQRGDDAALHAISGMFAYGLWREPDRTLRLARDHFGKKPLYWYADDEQFVFASEIKAILDWLDHRFDIDPVALDQFFTRGCINAPRTIYAGIHLLPAASTLTLDARPETWRWSIRSYWTPARVETPTEDGEAVDALEALLTTAVRDRLVSDVPIGCLLSGGIDSSLITALAAKASATPVKAFSIGFDENERLNELPYAELVARSIGCDWRHRLVRGADFLDQLDDTAACFDQPFANFAMFPTRLLARLAREELVVVLSGQGGDEMAAGYPGRYGWVMETESLARDRSRRREFAPAIDDLVQHLRHTSFLPWSEARAVIFAHETCAAITRTTPWEVHRSMWLNERLHQGDRLRRVQLDDVALNLPDYLITVEERMTMASSLEARNPFLDPAVACFLLSLPASMKMREGQAKWIVRELARRHVPAAAIDREKRGFTPPLDLWLAQHEAALRAIIRSAEPIVGHLFSPAWRAAMAGQPFTTLPLMAVFYTIIFALWARRHADHLTGNLAAASEALDDQTRNPWQALLREQREETLGEARWICQALGNFPEGTRLRIEGDRDGLHEALARASGLRTTDARDDDPVQLRSIEGRLIVNDAARSFAGLPVAESADLDEPIASDTPLLLIIPCTPAETSRLPRVLECLGERITIRGRQAIQIGLDRLLFIIRAEPIALPPLVTHASQ